MKHYRIFLASTILVLASLACNALTGGDQDNPAAPSDSSSDQVEQATEAPASSNDNADTDNATVDADFPMTDDAYQVVDIGDGSLLYYTKMPQADVLKFYRDEYTSRGYTERDLLTTVSEGIFSIVFDGDPEWQGGCDPKRGSW